MKIIEQNNEGKYVWGYELDLFKNSSVLKLVLKVVGLSFLAVFLFALLLSINDRDFFWKGFLENLKVFAILIPVMLVLAFVSYLIYAKIMNGKYCVIFEMDENGVKHTQLDKQTDKAKMISLVEMTIGAVSRNPGLVGSGLMKYEYSSIYTDFKKVKRIVSDRKNNAIILKYGLHNNQIYVEEDYDEVLNFIRDNCPLNK